MTTHMLPGKMTRRYCVAAAALVLCMAPPLRAATLIHQYDFNNNLADTLGGDALTVYANTATSGFGTNEWWWTASASPGGGLILDTSSITDPTNYSIGFRIKFNEAGAGYKKIISFKGSADDNGLYFIASNIVFYPFGQNSAITYLPNTFYDFVFSRNSSGVIQVYVVQSNATVTKVYEQSDTTNASVPTQVNGKYRFMFFMDDTSTSSEWTTGGTVRSIRVWNGPLSASQVADALSTAQTNAATSITSSGAIMNGTVNPRNSTTTVTFEYGTTTAYGSEILADQSPLSGGTSTSVSSTLTGLTSETTYHYRVKAVNGDGTTYGSDQTFTTASTSNLAATSGSAIFIPNGSAVVVDPGLTVTGSSITGFKVSVTTAFASGDTLTYTGTLPGGVTAAYNSTTGILTFTGTATGADWQALLRTVTFSTSSASATTRGISFTLGTAIPFSTTGHFYEFVSLSCTWSAAKTAAATRRLYGLQGYLATITSQAENDFIRQKLGADAWIGGSDEAVESVWRWMDGPESGTQFASGNSAVNNQFANWNNGEPNNCCGGENYSEIYSTDGVGKWNDLPGNYTLSGYVAEYGGMPGDPSPQISASRNVRITQLNALSFDGTDDYVAIGDINAMDNAQQLTIEMWVKLSSFSDWSTFASKRVSDTNRIECQLYTGATATNSDLGIAIGGTYAGNPSNGYGQTTSMPIWKDEWFHLAMVFDGTYANAADLAGQDANRLKLYINGAQQTLSFNYGHVPDHTPTNAASFTLGAANLGTCCFTAGVIDDVRVWTSARTQAQIQNNLNASLNGDETGLLMFFNFDQGTPGGNNAGLTTLPDKTANGYNGALNNFALTGSTSNWVAHTAPLGPEYQATSITADTITDVSARLRWTNGSGSRRAVFVKQADTGSASPVNLTTYTADASFGSGTQIGTSGWYCVYNGCGNTVTVSHLMARTSYRAMVCEFNGADGDERYLTSANNTNPATFQTAFPATSTNLSPTGVTNENGGVQVTNAGVNAGLEGYSPEVPVVLTIQEGGRAELTVGTQESPELIVTTVGAGFTDMTVTRIDDHSTGVAIQQSGGRIIRVILVEFPQGAHVNLDLGTTSQLVGNISNRSGQALDVSILSVDSGQSIVFTVTYHPPVTNPTGRTVWTTPGGSVTVESTGLAQGEAFTVAIRYDNLDRGTAAETDLRLLKLDEATSTFSPAGTTDRQVSSPTTTLGDYGVDTTAKTVWARVNQLGTFAVGVPYEYAPPATPPETPTNVPTDTSDTEATPPTACGSGLCGTGGLCTMPLTLLGLGFMRLGTRRLRP